jgi:cardiolipin synthase C
LRTEHKQMKAERIDYVRRADTGEPFNSMVSGRLPLIWAPAKLIYDSPDKRNVTNGSMVGKLMHRPLAKVARAAQSELLMITPYLIPGEEGMQLFSDLLARNVRVRILTNSLESSNVLVAHSGYMKYRVPLLKRGAYLYEIRAQLGNTRGSGQTSEISRHGNYSLHAKLFVFDRQKVFIGSMNYDQRSMHLNTEIGLIIDSPELARQVAARFEAMVQPANSYMLVLRPADRDLAPRLVWLTQEGGKPVEYLTEPARSSWQRFNAHLLALLPLDSEL